MRAIQSTVTRVDCDLVAATEDELGRSHYKHQYYRLSPRVIDDIRQVLSGKHRTAIKPRLKPPQAPLEVDWDWFIPFSDHAFARTPNVGDDREAKAEAADGAADALAQGAEDADIQAAGIAWRPADSIRKLLGQINNKAPRRNKASDGIIGDEDHQNRDSDHNPWIKDGRYWVVSAIDITNDPRNGCSAQTIVDAVVKSRDDRIKYIIWNRQIVSSIVAPWVWRDYGGENPHTRHFHLSVKPTKELYDSIAAWITS